MEINVNVACTNAQEAEAIMRAIAEITTHENRKDKGVKEIVKTPVKENVGNVGKAGHDTPPFETNETSEEDIREAASALVHKKGVSSLKTLLLRYKAEKVSSVKIEDRAEFLRELREFANA